MTGEPIIVNRAPVMALWGAVVARAKGYDWEAALTLGKVMSGLNAQAKGRSLGIFGPGEGSTDEGSEPGERPERTWVTICGRAIPAEETPRGLRAVAKGEPVDPAKVLKYLEGKFGDDYERVLAALTELAESLEETELDEKAYSLYGKFRPSIPKGKTGWGRKGELDLSVIRSLRKA